MYIHAYVRIYIHCIHTIRSNCACIYVCISVRMYMYVLMYMDVCCMHSARTGYIYECVCTGYIYECIPHTHAHACIHARIPSYLGRLGSALSSERPPVLVLERCFSSHPVLNRHLCVCVCERECVCLFMFFYCMCVWSATVIITANFCSQVCMRHRLRVSAN